MTLRSFPALLVSVLGGPVLGGCGAHGKTWVDPEPRSAPCVEEQARSVQWEEELKPPPRPRLQQVVTLGQSELPARERTSAPESAAASPVVVQVNNTFAPQYGYGAFVPAVPVGGCLGCGPVFVPARTSPAHTGAHLGRDWPAPRDSGPVFPFSAPPGDPWGGRR